jgi:putative FmdB family regulatory protein
MPIYPIRCTSCHHAGEVVAPVRRCNDLTCPECGARAEQDYARKAVHNTNTRFTGTRQKSWMEGYHPKSVEEARRLFGKDGGDCIQKDGTVLFKDRAEQQRYERKKRQLMEKADAKRRRNGMKTTADLAAES